MDGWREFGAELRRMRLRAGLSVRGLARELHYDPGALSRFENGRRKPPFEIVGALDRILCSGGSLTALYENLAATEPESNRGTRLQLRESVALNERRYIDSALAGETAELLAETRRLEDRIGSELVLPLTVRQARIASALALEARSVSRAPIVDVAAGWQQFAGWLHASLGLHAAAVRHYRAALELATESGDVNMIATALSMRGHVAWMAGEVGPMIGLSRAAQRNSAALSPTVLAMAVQQEGRGLALEGDLDAMEERLDTAAELLAGAGADRPDAQYFYSDALIDIQRGMAYRLARRWDKAVVWLDRGLTGFDSELLTSEWATWYVAEFACALAGAGEPEAACRQASQALRVAVDTPGSRLPRFLGDLHRQMSVRWGGNPAVAELGEELIRAGSPAGEGGIRRP
ncbi:helix-turn-helix domain-containing protein [Nocardia sp. CA-290969]|uniref:helix-turn-helix domain-containing protein n=1 Tax=Nocardia sp. CA-290969 TaxID=3239986 RepID=UPI003D94F4BF